MSRALDANIVCPHCLERGYTRTKRVRARRGVSGGKLVAAMLTCGFSILLCGLTRVEKKTSARCKHCGQEWTY